jgi:CubicO group peptidase (beta-lactamase class C family)
VTKQPFPQAVQERVWTPLGMTGAFFNVGNGSALESPPTEASSERGGLVQGYVHDENAFAMGGVSGHAGMFATAEDVVRLGVCFLADGRGLWPSTLVESALLPQSKVGSTRAIGFDLLEDGGFGGTKVPPGTFGHTGFTGTSLWCDPVHDVCVVLLTNRVHPTRDNNKIRDVRRQLHDLVLSVIDR